MKNLIILTGVYNNKKEQELDNFNLIYKVLINVNNETGYIEVNIKKREFNNNWSDFSDYLSSKKIDSLFLLKLLKDLKNNGHLAKIIFDYILFDIFDEELDFFNVISNIY